MLFCISCLAFLHIVLAVPVNHGNSNTFEGDIGLDPYTRSIVNGDLTPNQAFKGTKGRIWAGAIIPYTFDPNFGSERQTLMKQAMEVIEKKTCIRFRPRNREKDYVHMVNENACWSMIGRSGGKQLLKMGGHCLQLGTAKHELMHTIGFFHEQSRNDRDDHVKILWENIRDGESYNFKKYSTNYYGQSYDLNSIMHYRKWEFSSNGRDTIQSKSEPSLALGNLYFTERDLNAINAMYGCPSNPNPSSCRDLRTQCTSLAAQGLCEHRHHIHSMSQNCKHACGKC